MFEIERTGQLQFRNQRTDQPGDSVFRNLERESGQVKRVADHRLDKEDAVSLHGKLMGHFIRELERQAENRREMAMDEAMFDHQQWTEEEIAVLRERGQEPIVFNLIQTSINWVLGSQRRATMDYKILPRKKEGLKAAERKTELLRHLRDENQSEFEYARAFADAVKAGIGWIETGQANPEDGPIVFDRSESWRSILWDSTSVRPDLSDCRYLFRAKWLDVDTAMGLWKGRAGIIERAAANTAHGWSGGMLDGIGDEQMDEAEMAHFAVTTGEARHGGYYSERPRVRVIEAWFKHIVTEARLVRGGQFNGELFDEWSPGHWREIKEGTATLVARPREVIHVALMTESGLLDLRESPYRHNRYPFTPVWGYRRAGDGMPYGMIRGMRDIQRDLNKRASKALHHLSTTRVTVEKGAVADIEELRDEAGRPDAVLVYERGFQPPAVATDTQVAAAHMELMSRDAAMLQQVAGVTDENMGRSTNATSGKAILARQDQGQLATSMFFDNLRLARVHHGNKLIVNVEQFYTQKEQFRIVNQRGNADFIAINDGNPDNAIAETAADFIITEEDWRATARQAQAEELMDLMSKLAATAPQIVIQTLDLMVEALDVPKRDEIVKRIRQVTGMADPDADPNNPDPDTIAMNNQKQQAAALQERAAMAELTEKEAKARKAGAEATKIEQALAGANIDQLQAALQAAIAVAGAPALATAADHILTNARAEAAKTAGPANGGQPQPQPSPEPAMQEGYPA